MVIKLYISGISGNKEVKKKQQRVQMILDSKQINYEAIDITEPGKEKDKEFMQQNGKVRESLGKYPLPPQIFNNEDFCGDYEDFDLANEVDELEKFLHIETSSKNNESESKVNGLKEEIITINDLADKISENGEVKKSEVNGECGSVPASKSVTETSVEEVAPEKEEFSTREETGNEDGDEEKNEENIEDIQKKGGEEEAIEKKEENEDAEQAKNESVENLDEEKSPPSEEEEKDEDNKEKEIVGSEKEEEAESDSESPRSEKLQEE